MEAYEIQKNSVYLCNCPKWVENYFKRLLGKGAESEKPIPVLVKDINKKTDNTLNIGDTLVRSEKGKITVYKNEDLKSSQFIYVPMNKAIEPIQGDRNKFIAWKEK